jgi:superfamily II DNA helicase RecQ
MPDLIFVTVDTFSELTSKHRVTFLDWSQGGFIDRVIVDEVHTLFTETFRSVYHSLRVLGSLGCQVITMSGTLPRSLVLPMAKYLRLVRLEEQMNVIHDGDLFGSFPMGFLIKCEEVLNTTASAVSIIRQQVLESLDNRCVHVITASKKMAGDIADACEKLCICYKKVTSDDARDTMMATAAEWSDGSIEVLVSTTVALLGNENKNCRCVIIVGYLFDLMSLVQALGRLRPCQRTSTGSIRILLPKRNEDWFLRKKQDDFCRTRLLLERGLLTPNISTFEKIGTISSIREWAFVDEGCRIQSLTSRFGGLRDKCGVCDRCTATPITTMAAASQQLVRRDLNNLNSAVPVLKRLEEICIVCNSGGCDGEKCLGKACFKCGSGSHFSSSCTFVASRIISSRGCYYCFDLYCRQGYSVHTKDCCPTKRRLKRLMIEAQKM